MVCFFRLFVRQFTVTLKMCFFLLPFVFSLSVNLVYVVYLFTSWVPVVSASLPHIISLPNLLIHNAFLLHFFIFILPSPANRHYPFFFIPIQPHLSSITSTPVYVFVVSKQVVADGLFIFSPSLSLSHIIFSESVSLCWTKGRICSHSYPLVPSLPSFQFRHHI